LLLTKPPSISSISCQMFTSCLLVRAPLL
jgi:hypothetical protein